MKIKYIVLSAVVLLAGSLQAGNKDRIGQQGASQLKILPWGLSSGMHGANSSYARGLEAMSLNVAGLAFTRKTDLQYSYTSWLRGSEININSFGLGQRLGETSVLGISIQSMGFGDLEVTTVDLPEGGNLGTFSPQFLNIGLAYAQEFSNSIYGGVTVRVISESIANASARGVAFDAGIRYVTGDKNRIKFGIALQNVGPKMQYTGDGFSTKVTLLEEELTLQQRTQSFELPALLSIGASYDFFLGAAGYADSIDTKYVNSDHKITLCGTYLSNSFGKDQWRFGVEYAFKKYFQLRGGYFIEQGLNFNGGVDMTNAYTGPSAGFSLSVPFAGESLFGIDYSYRSTISFDGTHTLGLRLQI